MAPPEITPTQEATLAVLGAALDGADRPRCVVYRTEWVGWIVDPVTFHVEVDGQDVNSRLPANFRWRDLDALANVGFLPSVGEWQNPEDEYDRRITYELVGRGQLERA